MIFQKYKNLLFVTSKIKDKNMSLIRGNPQEATNNRVRFFQKYNINVNTTAEVNHVHSNKVIKISQSSYGKGLKEADGILTDKPNLYLMIKAADCHQIAFFDPKNQAIALIHAGWRGLDKRIIKNCVNKMAEYFNSKPENLLVELGPSIGPCCYRIDIWEEALKQLRKLKIPAKNIYNPRICTYHTGIYYSHKRAIDQSQDDFRFITILGLKKV